MNSTFSKEVDGKTEKMLFPFVSETIGPDGKPYEYAVWTGLHYGDKRAALTLLLNMLIPNLPAGTRVKIADLEGKQYKSYIQHKTNANTGKAYAEHLYILPVAVSTPAQDNPQAQATAPVPPTNAAVMDAGMTAPVMANGSVPPTGATPAMPQLAHVPAVAVLANGTDAPVASPTPAVYAPPVADNAPDDADTTLSQW